jgi:RNA polymerase sigma-70 factor (ECF subfamily)
MDRMSDAETPVQDSPGVRVLVEAAQAGDHESFGELVRLHQRVAVRTAMAALGSRADAEDAAQEAFLLAWRKLHTFRADAAFRTWLLKIVWRQAVGTRRAGQRWWDRLRPANRRRSAATNEDRAFADVLPYGGPSPEAAAIGRSLARQTARAISRLPPHLRDTLLLAASGAHSYAEIGLLLGVATGTVKWRVSEARRLVSLAMEDHRER